MCFVAEKNAIRNASTPLSLKTRQNVLFGMMMHVMTTLCKIKTMENKKFELGIYLIGSLRNEEVPKLARRLREALNVEVFDDWFSPGPKADDFWRLDEIRHSQPQRCRKRAMRQAIRRSATRGS